MKIFGKKQNEEVNPEMSTDENGEEIKAEKPGIVGKVLKIVGLVIAGIIGGVAIALGFKSKNDFSEEPESTGECSDAEPPTSADQETN